MKGLFRDMIERAKADLYDGEFYADWSAGSLRSAEVIIPMVLEHFPVQSAVDVGCGLGAWLRVLEISGVTDIVGYDGHHIDRSKLLIDPTTFRAVDLCGNFEFHRTFDIAISLEVAEHLPSEFAEPFIRRLVTAAPIVLFSAAIPDQQGVNHVNEHWQDYWRSVFTSFNFHPVDLVRPMVWGNPNVEYFYQQNIILYCSEEALENNGRLQKAPEDKSLNLVHPNLYEIIRAGPHLSLKAVLKLLPTLAWNAVARRIETLNEH